MARTADPIDGSRAPPFRLRQLPGIGWIATWFAIWGKKLGPGLITGAADDDPSGIVTYSMVGAQHGTGLLWTTWAMWPLMAAVQLMCARIGLVTGEGLGKVFKRKFPRSVVLAVCCGLFVANTINIAADLSGMAAAGEMLTGVKAIFLVPLFGAAVAYALVHYHYEAIARILKWLVLSLFAYVVTAFLVRPHWGDVARATFLPSLPQGTQVWESIVALLGTTISPYLFFWQASLEVEELEANGESRTSRRTRVTRTRLLDRTIDVGVGGFLSNLIAFFIILTAALTLHQRGITDIQSSRQAAEALAPLAGNFAAALYAFALITVGLLAIPTLAGSAGYAFSEAFNWPHGLSKDFSEAHAFYGVILLSVGLGIGSDFFQFNPMKFLFWSAVINGVLAPFLLCGILLVAGDRTIMKEQTSSVLNRTVVGITTLLMFGAALVMLYGIWHGDM